MENSIGEALSSTPKKLVRVWKKKKKVGVIDYTGLKEILEDAVAQRRSGDCLRLRTRIETPKIEVKQDLGHQRNGVSKNLTEMFARRKSTEE